MTDDELMHAITLGDQTAFTELVERHLDRLYSYAYRLTQSVDQAEDLSQDTWLKVWEHAATYRAGKVRFSTWLYRVLHNRFVDVARKKAPEFDTVKVEQAFSNTHFDGELERQQQHAKVHQALHQLPPQQRAALLLGQVQGFANAEVAHILGLSIRAVESLQARGRRKMRQLLINTTQSV